MQKILLVLGILVNIISLYLGLTKSFSSSIILVFSLSLLMTTYVVCWKNIKALKILTLSLVVVFVLVLAFDIFLYQYGKSDNVTYNEDAVIVLGAGINGETPSLILSHRLDAAWEYSQKNPNAVFIVTGGQGPRESITEALAMERYLVAKGVPATKIIKEEKATSTNENIAFSKELLDEYFVEPYKVAIITNDFHIFRSIQIAKRAGLESTRLHSKIPRYTIIANYLRETIAIVFFVFSK